jgi:hypothetical protein
MGTIIGAVVLVFAGLLMRWGVSVRPAPESPVAQRVRELRGGLSWVVVETIQEDFLVPRQVIEELLQGMW